jgi:hypothetical protein
MISCFGLGLVILSPVIALIVQFPSIERFAELQILDSDQRAENYPFSVEENKSYLVYLVVDNHMGHLGSYRIYTKFGNQSDPLPNTRDGVPSSLSELYERRLFLQDGGKLEKPLNFSFSGITFNENRSFVSSISIDGYTFDVSRFAVWDTENKGYYFQIFFELWFFDTKQESFFFANQYVGLKLNMTSMG